MGSAAGPMPGNGDEGEENTTNAVGIWNKVLDLQEAKAQIMFSLPMILTSFAYYAIPLISAMFAGHLGELELAAATLGNSWSSVTGLALMTGLSGALETLCGQAYGAELYKMLGIYLQASVITTFIFSVIVAIIWFFSENILVILHQDHEIVKMAAVFLRCLIPGIFAYAILQCTLRFLQTQNVVMPLMFFSITPLVIHIGLTYALVYHTALGFKGAALSASLSLWISVVMLGLYVKFSKKFKRTWTGLSLECFQHIPHTMKLAIPSALMVCLEYWAFEIMVILAGVMPNAEISTSLIAMSVTIQGVAFMFTYGFSAAASTRISNSLGAGNVARAKNVVAVTLKLSIAFAVTLVVFMVLGHNIWAAAFSNSHAIKKAFAAMTPFLATTFLLDSVQGVLGGVARGCGWQHLAAWTNLAGYYGIGMVVAVPLAFKAHLYTKGLWIGLICALVFQTCTLLFITLRTDWSKLKLSVERDEGRAVSV